MHTSTYDSDYFGSIKLKITRVFIKRKKQSKIRTPDSSHQKRINHAIGAFDFNREICMYVCNMTMVLQFTDSTMGDMSFITKPQRLHVQTSQGSSSSNAMRFYRMTNCSISWILSVLKDI